MPYTYDQLTVEIYESSGKYIELICSKCGKIFK